jgi:F-type H+-transporting ATPase subunit epsilon
MSLATHMRVSLRVPTRLLHEGDALRLVATAENGTFGLLPNHADHVTSLAPSVLVLTDDEGKEHFFGIDHGLLVKRGHQVDIAVQRAVRGESLETLAATIDTLFTQIDEEERLARTAMSRLEIGMVRHFSELRKPA